MRVRAHHRMLRLIPAGVLRTTRVVAMLAAMIDQRLDRTDQDPDLLEARASDLGDIALRHGDAVEPPDQ